MMEYERCEQVDDVEKIEKKKLKFSSTEVIFFKDIISQP